MTYQQATRWYQKNTKRAEALLDLLDTGVSVNELTAEEQQLLKEYGQVCDIIVSSDLDIAIEDLLVQEGL